MEKLKVFFEPLLFVLSFFWIFSFYFCFYPSFFNINFWSKVNFVSTFFFLTAVLVLISLLEGTHFKKTIFLLIFFLILFLISFFKIFSFSFLLTLILSLFFMFFLWLITLIYGISFLNYRNLNAIYFLIVLGIFIVFNVIFYFLIVNNFLNEKQIFLGPILSFLLIVWSIFTLKSSFFEIKFFLTQIGIVIFLALFSFLFTSLTDNFSKILTFFSLLLFLILSWQFEKNIFFETKRKKEIEKILKEQKELLEAKEQFILSIQHHLRTPLGPIREYLNRILQGFYGNLDNPVIKKRLVEVKKLADDVYYLVEQLIEIQRYKTKRDSIKLEKCQIEEIIESVVNELLSSAQEKGLYLEYEKIPLPSLEIDRKKIKEAIFNLVDNAIKYTRTGGVKIKNKIENKKLKIEISDTGIGMEKEEIEKFLKGTLFERGIEAKKMYGSGKGIGLSLAIQFVEAHGGKIFAKSEGFGKGTTFWIELPLK